MIQLVYSELQAIGAVQNSCQFSTDWLGMERNYYSVMRSKGRKPSAKALSHCARCLVTASQAMSASRDAVAQVNAVRLRCLAQLCVHGMLPAEVVVIV